MSEENTDIKISFETLYELLRREKHRSEIQKLSGTFFIDVVGYLSEKKSELEQNNNFDLFTATKKAKSRNQIENIIQIINELYSRREKKIIMLAMNKARTGSDIVDTTNLLPEEKKLLNVLIMNLESFRDGILKSLLGGKVPEIDSLCRVTNNQQIPNNQDQNNNQNNNQTESTDENMKTVRFTNAVPKFVGKELEVYGPFAEEDIANLPSDIANLLIKKGRAKEMSTG